MQKKFGIVDLTSCDANGFSVLGRCQAAARKGDMSPSDWGEFLQRATGGCFDTLLFWVQEYFDVRIRA